MKKRHNVNLINVMNHMLDGKKSLTLESVVFGQDGEGPVPYENGPGYDWMPSMDDEDDAEEVQQAPADPEVTGYMNQIRQIAIQGLAKLANTPESPQYDVLKKIWQILDKSVEIGKGK